MGQYPKYSTEAYSDETYLNTLDICIPREPSTADSTRYWVLFIHGGGWRDPEIGASSFKQIQEKLLTSSVSDNISGYASIDYRLSSYPSHPTNPSNPSDPARNAVHPDHINDVLAAILYLQEKYHFEDRYILAGHSAGATMAMQVAMKRYWGSQYESTYALELNVVPPIAIVGLSGIYDIPALVKNHEDQAIYRDFIHNAFGASGWDAVSPTNGDYDDSWPDGKLVVLAHSPNDSLVEIEQPKAMKDSLVAQGWKESGERKWKTYYELKGEHDEIWDTGEAAEAIEVAIKDMLS
jgi:acetyl esterase/lipase